MSSRSPVSISSSRSISDRALFSFVVFLLIVIYEIQILTQQWTFEKIMAIWQFMKLCCRNKLVMAPVRSQTRSGPVRSWAGPVRSGLGFQIFSPTNIIFNVKYIIILYTFHFGKVICGSKTGPVAVRSPSGPVRSGPAIFSDRAITSLGYFCVIIRKRTTL